MQADPASLRLTNHAYKRFRERINPHGTYRMLANLASDARPPTDEEWKRIEMCARRVTLKPLRMHGRDSMRVLGSLVFVIEDNAVITCWRAKE